MAKAKQQSAIERAKARLKGMKDKKGGEFPFNYLDIPAESKLVVRVFPSWDKEKDPGEFYREAAFHRNIGKEGKFVLCPKSAGEKECPICERFDTKRAEALKIRKKNQTKGDALLKKNDELKAQSRFFMNAVRLTESGPVQTHDKSKGQPAEKPEVLAQGPMVMEQILAAYVEDEADICGAFWEPKTRYDFLIKKTGKKLGTKYTVTPTRKYAKVDTEALEENLHNLDEVGEVLSYDELEALLNGEEPEEKDEEPDEDEETEADEPDEDEDESDDEDEDSDDEESDDDEDGDEESDDDEDGDDESDDDESDDDEDEGDDDEDEGDDDEDESDEDEDSDEDESDEDEDSDEDESDEDEDSDEDDSDEEEPDEDEEKPAKGKKAAPKAKAKAAPKAKAKAAPKAKGKEGSQKATPKAGKGAEEQKKPICFGDSDDHDPKDPACKTCPFFKECAGVVKSKKK